MNPTHTFTIGGTHYEVDIFQFRGAWTLSVRNDVGDCIHRLEGLPSKSDARERAAAYRNRLARSASLGFKA